MSTFERNKLIYGDNLPVLRNFPDECVDLIYLDPPFNSKRNYNVYFKEKSGRASTAQVEAFSDTWSWFDEKKVAQNIYLELQRDPELTDWIKNLCGVVGKNDMMAYLVMMIIRLKEIHRVLKPTGSIYLHCDPTADAYIRIVLDKIFGPENFRNEIVWCYTGRECVKSTKFAQKHNIIFFYTKSNDYVFNRQYIPYSEKYKKLYFDHTDENGNYYQLQSNGKGGVYRQYLDDPGKNAPTDIHYTVSKGVMMRDWWNIKPIHGRDRYKRHESEFLGYPTQKPEALLERIIKASSNEGDIVLDPFCGCGTAISVAQKLNRKWIGIDITYLATSLIKNRLKLKYKLSSGIDYDEIGVPVDYTSAKHLADHDKYQFQFWSGSLVPGFLPNKRSKKSPFGKKGKDKGVDGWITFKDCDEKRKPTIEKIVVQVKGGENVNAGVVRDLVGTVNNTNSMMGILITLNKITKPMKIAAYEAGRYTTNMWGISYPRIQIRTVQQLLDEKKFELPYTREYEVK